MTDSATQDPLTWNCPHIGQDGWGCGAAAGEACDWSHDPPATPGEDRTFHAERRLLAEGGDTEIPTAIVEDVAVKFVG